ncbi:hypothetical protein [Alsobacter sp. R-9]
MAGLRILLLSAGLAGVIAPFPGAFPAAAGTVPTPECQRDLIVTQSDLRQAEQALSGAANAPKDQLCKVWRDQIAVFKKSAATYRRCKTDTERRVLSAQMDSQALDFQSAVDQLCKGR